MVNKAASKATRNPTNRHRSRAKVASRADVNRAANVKASSKTDNDGFQPRRKCRGYLFVLNETLLLPREICRHTLQTVRGPLDLYEVLEVARRSIDRCDNILL